MNTTFSNHSFIPLFHKGHESPESPRIEFFFYMGEFVRLPEVSFSNRDVLRVSPDSDTMPLRISGESALFGWNRARIQYD